ncbi:MAG: DUF4834 family protein [Bacteroidaceae bacterium]|nr:DUF4834 family protein [Bacteroidaceae bacterium]
MFQFLGCLIMLVILLPVLLIGGILLKTWNVVNGNKKGKWYGGYNNTEQNSSAFSQGNTNSQRSGNSHANGDCHGNGNYQGRGSSSHKQIFKDNEGEYVDFQEVDE